jgi:Ca2+-binding RTX toxin-like protein
MADPRPSAEGAQRKHRRLPVSFALAAVLIATSPHVALAADVSMPAFPDGVHMTYTPAAGETNNVTVEPSGDRILLRQFGESTPLTLSAMGDCQLTTTTEPKLLNCAAAGVVQLDVTLGDNDDRLTNSTGLRAMVAGDAGDDKITGGGLSEQFEGGAGSDTLDGGPGNDQLYGATLQAPGAGTDTDVLAGGIGDDRLFGNGGADRMDGGSGVDELQGAGGGDIMQGGDGPDRVLGGDGDDTEHGGAENDDLLGGAGDDTLSPGAGPPLADGDAISGGDGTDAVSYGARMTPVNVSKNGVADDGELTERDNVGIDVERISGGSASDTLQGGPGPDVLEGLPGDDTIAGLDGDDTLLGDAGPGAGADKLSAGAGADVVRGEGGDDSLNGGPGPDQIFGGSGRDALAYTNEPDVLVRLDARRATSGLADDRDRLDDVDDVRGGSNDDTVTGSGGSNSLTGAAGEDYLDALNGVDRLDGGRSPDVVVARDGVRDEPVSCGAGRDLAIVDGRDSVVQRGSQRCELVDDGRRTRPRPGLVYVQPQRCGASQGVELALPVMHRQVPLRYSILLPSGYRGRSAPTLDASDCPVRVTATPRRGRRTRADVSGGAVWISQSSGRRVATTLGISPPACAAGARTTAAAAQERGVRVRTRRRPGRWRVKGRFSIGASEATDWTTVEDCSSTTTIVRRGRVRVFDRVKDRTVIVRAGDQYVAQR